jgi:hypothetical protein
MGTFSNNYNFGGNALVNSNGNGSNGNGSNNNPNNNNKFANNNSNNFQSKYDNHNSFGNG